MLKKIASFVFAFFKGNLMFGLGMVFGSVIGTLTTIFLTMGYFGAQETIGMYQLAICGGM